jgi:predicted pyridoxine 5'-phosphate oxidase superfamily flavin-nucleotide-binding protein
VTDERATGVGAAGDWPVTLAQIERCFGGAVPAALATSAADGTANVTYISRAHRVDDHRVALSNQFMSKTARNLAANPRADLLLIDPVTYDEYRLALVYERTERRGPLFERMKADIAALAELEGMQDVYRLRAADVYRVVELEQIPANPAGSVPEDAASERPVGPELAQLAQVVRAVARAGDADIALDTALEALDRVLGHRYLQFLLLDGDGRRLSTIASRGYDDSGIGAEVELGEGQIGTAAARCEPIRAGGLRQAGKYSRSIRTSYELSGVHPGREVAPPGLPGVNSRIAVPATTAGQLVGVLVAESVEPAAYDVVDEHLLGVVASLLASAIELDRLAGAAEEPLDIAQAADAAAISPAVGPGGPVAPVAQTGTALVPGAPVASRLTAPSGTMVTAVRFFDVDGSVFLGTDYLIKGVAGRILWTLVRQHVADGRVEFTNRELRLDPSLDLPGFKDNLESRLILLKRRLDERSAPVRIEKTGRGRFRLLVSGELRPEAAD